jgi:hypothetical protein
VLRGALADLPPAEPTPSRGETQAELTRNHNSIGLRWLARDRQGSDGNHKNDGSSHRPSRISQGFTSSRSGQRAFPKCCDHRHKLAALRDEDAPVEPGQWLDD